MGKWELVVRPEDCSTRLLVVDGTHLNKSNSLTSPLSNSRKGFASTCSKRALNRQSTAQRCVFAAANENGSAGCGIVVHNFISASGRKGKGGKTGWTGAVDLRGELGLRGEVLLRGDAGAPFRGDEGVLVGLSAPKTSDAIAAAAAALAFRGDAELERRVGSDATAPTTSSPSESMRDFFIGKDASLLRALRF